MAALEAAALNGELFNPHRSPSPARSLSTASEPNTDDELGSDISRASSPGPSHPSAPTIDMAGRGGAKTGPKGVINDREAQRHSDRLAQSAQRLQMAEQQRRKTMIGVTSTEEDELREEERLLKESEEDAIAREQRRVRRRAEIEKEQDGGSVNDVHREYRRGGLREVGKEGFLSAVERPGWTVVLIYEPVSSDPFSLQARFAGLAPDGSPNGYHHLCFAVAQQLIRQNIPRCNAILASTLSLALSLPQDSITLLRARASQLGFSLLPASDPDDIDEEPEAYPDVLPTLLAYKDGDLRQTWIRVDWEVKEDGVEGLLKRQV